MKKLILACVSVAVLVLSGCNPFPTRVHSGHVAVLVSNVGGDKGVRPEEIGPGYYWPLLTEDIYEFPTFQQTRTWGPPTEEGAPDERFLFQTGDGMRVVSGAGVTYTVDPTKVSVLFTRYRRGIDEITDIYLHNMIRDAFVEIASKHPVEYVYGAGKTELINQVQAMVAAQVAPFGIKIEKINWIGDLQLPKSVEAAIDAKIVATQKTQQRENEIAQVKAEAQKAIEAANGRAQALLTVARAEAEANQLKQATLTAELIQYETVTRWNGKLPETVVGAGSGLTPMINLR